MGYNQIGNLDELVTRKFKMLSTLILRNNPIHSLSFEGNSKPAYHHFFHDDKNNPTPTLPSASILNPNEVVLHGQQFHKSLDKIPNVFRPESFPRLFELSLSFCELSGELAPFPALALTNLEISNGLKSATSIKAESFQALRELEWIALDNNQIVNVR